MPIIFINPAYDIIILAILIYLAEYGFFKFFKINIFQAKYMIAILLIDLIFLLIVAFVFGYYKSNLVFPFGLNRFWYSLIVMVFVEFACMELFAFKIIGRKNKPS